jgi:NADPH:quinone reductase-like Zn-dependent oxidoreductase
MRAVTIVEGSLEWREHPDPEPGPGELLVAVRAAGVNAADLLQRRGRYPAPPGSPVDIPGMEFAGEVLGVGPGATRFSPGDRVARLTAGERVLVSGAAGGVGTAAVQLAHAAGARVVATVRSAARREEVRTLGADEVVAPEAVADHGPYDVSLELVGAPGVAVALPLLEVGGRVVVIGVGAGATVDLELLTLMGRRATIGGSTLRSRTREEKAEVARAVEAAALPLLADGTVRVPVAETFPMAEGQQAYERFAEGGKLGKIVLVN